MRIVMTYEILDHRELEENVARWNCYKIAGFQYSPGKIAEVCRTNYQQGLAAKRLEDGLDATLSAGSVHSQHIRVVPGEIGGIDGQPAFDTVA